MAGVSNIEAERTKNLFALGLVYWLYDRPLEPTLTWIAAKFKRTRRSSTRTSGR